MKIFWRLKKQESFYKYNQFIVDCILKKTINTNEAILLRKPSFNWILTVLDISYQNSNQTKAAFDYDGPEEPCSGRYGDYNCMYDAVYDFKVKKLFKDRSVIMGQ